MAQKFVTGITIRDLASAASDALAVSASGDSYDRIRVEAGGKVVWGDGTATGDSNLYRDAADRLKTDDVFQSAAGLVTTTSDGAPTDSLPDGALVVDVTNDILYVRSGGTWLPAGGASGEGASGSDGYVQFATSGVLNSASAFAWDNANSTLNVSGLVNSVNPVRSGQIGDAGPDHPAYYDNNGILQFNETWVDRGGITYSAITDRFTVPEAGIYRITFSGLHYGPSSTNTDLRIGINTDAPGNGDPASTDTPHRGHTFVEDATYTLPCYLNSVVELEANDYIVFYLKTGKLYNLSTNRYNQYTIERIA